MIRVSMLGKGGQITGRDETSPAESRNQNRHYELAIELWLRNVEGVLTVSSTPKG